MRLKPGDCLLYHSHGPFGWFIRLKTWSDVSHVEVYLGNEKSFASRDGQGVDIYPLKRDNISYVLRPRVGLNMVEGLKWANEVKGRKYDWWGLLRFFRIGAYNDKKMFCSEAATQFYQKCGFYPFHPKYCPGDVSPGMFKSSAELDVIYDFSGG